MSDYIAYAWIVTPPLFVVLVSIRRRLLSDVFSPPQSFQWRFARVICIGVPVISVLIYLIWHVTVLDTPIIVLASVLLLFYFWARVTWSFVHTPTTTGPSAICCWPLERKSYRQ